MGKAGANIQPRPDPIYLGWRHAVLWTDPGPAPKRPSPADHTRVDPEWVAEQRRVEADINRPLVVALVGVGVLALLLVLLWLLRFIPGLFMFVGLLLCVLVALPLAVGLWQGRQVTLARIAEEQRRLVEQREERERELRERQEEHARKYTEWQARKRAYEAQPRWYAVAVPEGTTRVNILGGSNVGWSAATTTIAAARLRVGGDVTVVDLSGRAVASDLVALARHCGVSTRVWVLPADIRSMDLGTNLGADAMADILSAVVASRESGRDAAADGAMLKQLLDILGPDAGVTEITAALRVLAEERQDEANDPVARILTTERRAELRERLGTDTETRERAWELERHLSALEGLATRASSAPYSQVKVIATDRTSGDAASRMYGTYTLAALRHLLHHLGKGRGDSPEWAHTVLVCGAELVRAEERDALAAAAERAGVGLVLMYRQVGEEDLDSIRLGGGRSLVAVMRVEDTDSARVVAALLGQAGGAAGDLVPRRLTEVIGEALSGTIRDSYTGDEPVERRTPAAGKGRQRRVVSPLDLVRHMTSVTSWGRITRQAEEIDEEGDTDGGSSPPARLRIDERSLGALPHTAMIVVSGGGMTLADCNPGILGLSTATLSTAEEVGPERSLEATPVSEIEANLGPPAERLDWRSQPGRAEGRR